MPRAGGTSAKVGVRYEDRWSAYCALRVLAEEADAIHIERPGPEYEGFEFSLETKAGIEYHQAKRQRTGAGAWTLSALAGAGVMRSFRERLNTEDARCVFVSADAAPELVELADRAAKAESSEEFEQDFLDSGEWRLKFDRLVEVWEAEREWCWRALRQVEVRTIDEQTLKERVSFEAQLRLTGGGKSTSGGLIEVVRECVNRRMRAADLWSRLEQEVGLKPNPLLSSALGAVQLRTANERFHRSRLQGRIGGRLLARKETAKLREAIALGPVALLQGQAGMGKSEVLCEFLAGLEKSGTPYLVCRLDRLRASTTAAEVGTQLGLKSPPPVALSAVAAGGESVLVFDQLDAISTTSGRNPEFLDAIEEILRLALADQRMKIVLACRSFDARNDARIRGLIDREPEGAVVEVGPLSESETRAALTGMGVAPEAVSDDLIELCSVPLHLSLMDQIAARKAVDVGRLKTLNDLYARYWDDKQTEIRETLRRDPRWTEVLDPILDRMSEEPALEAPRLVVDDLKADVDAMLSAGVLGEEDGRLAFFHETFFDYAFARRFAGRGRSLEGLLSSDQLLFRRGQVRQVLAHSRESSPSTYEEDLAVLLGAEKIRFHLKELVLAWLRTVPEPREEEFSELQKLIEGEAGPLADRAWVTLHSPGWFRFLDRNGKLAEWLDAEGEVKARALGVLSAAGPEDSESVARLLAPHQKEDNSEADLESVLIRAEVSESRELFDLLLDAVAQNGDLGRRDFWFLAHDLPKRRAAWACELLGAFLKARLDSGELIVQRGALGGAELAPRGLQLHEYVVPAAEGAPAAFIKHVWPSMLAVIEATADEPREDRLRQSRIWGLRHFGDGQGELEDELLAGAERAMALRAKRNAPAFEALLDDLADTSHEAVLAILYAGLAANPARLGDRAVEILLADPNRFRVGRSNSNHWGSRELLEAIAPHCSPAVLEGLGENILNYYPSWEKMAASRGKAFGLAQFELLGGIPAETRTPSMAKRFAELQRKFEAEDANGPVGMRGGMVGSPIPETSARKMDDANWRRAMERYAGERDPEGDFLKGGAAQLSGVLESFCKEEPVRFARLGVSLPDEINDVYFEALLRGVGAAETSVPVAEAEGLVERCHRLPERPCGRWIAHPLRADLVGEISPHVLEILGWYAVEGDGEPTISFDDEGDEDEAERNLLTRGLNTVRGGMAYEFARLIQADGSRIPILEATLRDLCSDDSVPVQAMVAEVVLAVASHDTDLAAELFFLLASSADDALLATPHMRRFMVWFAIRDYERLRPLIERMIASPLRRVRRDGAAQAAAAALSEEAAQSLAAECEAGAPELRVGVARVFAQGLSSAGFRVRCEEGLMAAFKDADPEVRKAGAEAIRRLPSGQMAPSERLIKSFLRSPAFPEHAEQALFAFDDADKVSSELALEACERTLEMLDSPDAELRRAGRVAREVSEILTRAYVDASMPEQKERALDVIDRSLEIGAYGAERALSEHDR